MCITSSTEKFIIRMNTIFIMFIELTTYLPLFRQPDMRNFILTTLSHNVKSKYYYVYIVYIIPCGFHVVGENVYMSDFGQSSPLDHKHHIRINVFVLSFKKRYDKRMLNKLYNMNEI